MVLSDKVLFYSFQLVLIILLKKNWGSGSGSGSGGSGSFYRLDLLGTFDPIKHFLPLGTNSSPGPRDTTFALNCVPLPYTTSQWLSLDPSPSSLSQLDCPGTIFWALRFLNHKFDVLIHMLMTLQLYLEHWHFIELQTHYKCDMFNYVQLLFLLWIVISTFRTTPQPSRYSSEIEKKFYIFQCTEIQYVQRRSPSWLYWLGCDGCCARPGKEWTRRNESRSPSLLVSRSCREKKVRQRELCGAYLPFLNFRPAGDVCYSS